MFFLLVKLIYFRLRRRFTSTIEEVRLEEQPSISPEAIMRTPTFVDHSCAHGQTSHSRDK